MKFRTAVAMAAASLVASGGVVAMAGSAAADLTTRCVGEGGAVTVPGDLVVPRGKSCWLDGTTVKGDVRVGKGADLIVVGGTFEGRVRVAENGFLDVTDTTVAGNIGARDAFGTYVYGSDVNGAVNARSTGAGPTGFVYVVDSGIDRKVDARVPGELVIENATVGGRVHSEGTTYTDVYNSVVEGRLTVSGAAEGGVVCKSEVYGNASYTGNAQALQIGANGPIVACDGVNYWGGNLDVSDNTGQTVVSNNIIAGDLTGSGNDPAPTGENNRVRGAMSGQFADLQPAASMMRMASSGDRGEAVADRAAERRAQAKAEADKAGDARL